MIAFLIPFTTNILQFYTRNDNDDDDTDKVDNLSKVTRLLNDGAKILRQLDCRVHAMLTVGNK